MSLTGRTALVTGASRGIGAAVARALAAAGVRLALAGRDKARLDGIVDAVGHGAVALVADLVRPDAVADIAERATNVLGGTPDIVVHAAGSFPMAPLEDVPDASLDVAFALNAAAPLRLTRALLGAMRARGSGHIVTIGSIADRNTFPANAVYAASKHAARAFHETLRAETRASGIRATIISPSATDTPIWDPYDPDAAPHLPSRADMLRPEDVADAVVWAVSRPAHVTIEELRLSRS